MPETPCSQGYEARLRARPAALAVEWRPLQAPLLVPLPRTSHVENKLNANFAEHAEHEYMTFVASHPELETRAYESQALSENGTFSSEADALRQVGHDERVHKVESRRAAHRPKRQL